MLLRKPLPLWISVSLFALAAAMIPLIGHLRRPPISRPRTQTELAARLSQGTPPLHIVLLHQAEPEGPLWLCVRPQSPEYLGGLLCDPTRVQAGQWQGIVHCRRMGGQSMMYDEFIRENWGEYGMRIGPFVFFGDPGLLQRIRAEIPD